MVLNALDSGAQSATPNPPNRRFIYTRGVGSLRTPLKLNPRSTAGACVYVFTKDQLFFVWVFVFFVSTIFSIHSYLLHKSKNRKLYYHKDWEVSIMLYYLLWYNKSVTIISSSIRNFNATTSDLWTKDKLWQKNFRKNIKRVFCYYRPPYKNKLILADVFTKPFSNYQ